MVQYDREHKHISFCNSVNAMGLCFEVSKNKKC